MSAQDNPPSPNPQAFNTIGYQQLHRVKETIPWGTQTNGKRVDELMEGWTPCFVERAEGCRFQDTEGRWFIDYRSALGPIILGYNYPVVQAAVRKQLEKGVVFSLASPLEYEVAEQLTLLIPGIEQVRFLKSGNEANLAAIRLARASTDRGLIVTCGYHGHGDWFSCGTGHRPDWVWAREGNGVPAALDALVHSVAYGDIEALERVFEERGDDIAGLIMVPHDWQEAHPNAFVEKARALTHSHGALLIFDQVLTGFRLGLQGAQGYFGIVPDLSTYGKAIANGYPVAVFAGKKRYMSLLDRVMITTTHAGEALSLAAAKATLDVMQAEPVFEHIQYMGRRIMDGFNTLARQHGSQAMSMGLPQAPGFVFHEDPEVDQVHRHLFTRELLKEGVFPSRMFLMSYAHKEADVDHTLRAMERALREINLSR